MTAMSIGDNRFTRYALKLLPHPQPPVPFGLLNVKPQPSLAVTESMVTPLRYWAENASMKTRIPLISAVMSSSPPWSSMLSEYLNPEQPPGSTETRNPPDSAG